MKHLKKFESFSMHRELCDRCHKPTGGVITMSIFNTDVICMPCKEEEKNDPEYQAACDAEREAIKGGNYNFNPIPNYKPIKRK